MKKEKKSKTEITCLMLLMMVNLPRYFGQYYLHLNYFSEATEKLVVLEIKVHGYSLVYI